MLIETDCRLPLGILKVSCSFPIKCWPDVSKPDFGGGGALETNLGAGNDVDRLDAHDRLGSQRAR